MIHVKNNAPRREEKSSLSFVPVFGISLTYSNIDITPGPLRNFRYALEACKINKQNKRPNHFSTYCLDQKQFVGSLKYLHSRQKAYMSWIKVGHNFNRTII